MSALRNFRFQKARPSSNGASTKTKATSKSEIPCYDLTTDDDDSQSQDAGEMSSSPILARAAVSDVIMID